MEMLGTFLLRGLPLGSEMNAVYKHIWKFPVTNLEIIGIM